MVGVGEGWGFACNRLYILVTNNCCELAALVYVAFSHIGLTTTSSTCPLRATYTVHNSQSLPHRNLPMLPPQDSTLTPLLWPDADLEALLVGSPVLPEARARRDALRQQWADLAPKLAADPASFPPGRGNRVQKIEVQLYILQ